MEFKVLTKWTDTRGRLYPKDEMIAQMQRLTDSGQFYGELGYSESLVLELNKMSHMIKSFRVDENDDLFITVKWLKTPCGLIAETLSEKRTSVRSVGIVQNNVISELKLISIDIVT